MVTVWKGNETQNTKEEWHYLQIDMGRPSMWAYVMTHAVAMLEYCCCCFFFWFFLDK